MKYLCSQYLTPQASVPSVVKYLWSIHSVLGSVIGNMNLQRRWTQPLASICQSCRRGAPIDRRLYHSVRCTLIEGFRAQRKPSCSTHLLFFSLIHTRFFSTSRSPHTFLHLPRTCFSFCPYDWLLLTIYFSVSMLLQRKDILDILTFSQPLLLVFTLSLFLL